MPSSERACGSGLTTALIENIIGTRYGVYRASTIKGVPEDKRWDAANVLAVVGLPWDPTPNIDAEDGARVPNADVTEAEVIPKIQRFRRLWRGGCTSERATLRSSARRRVV